MPADPDNDAREARFRAEVEAALPRNYATHLVHGMLGRTGFQIIQAPTFLPAYVYALSGSAAIVGVARACQALGQVVTPLLGATLVEQRRKVLPMTFVTGALMRLQVLLLALAGFWLGREANLVAVCVLLGLFGLFSGMQAVTFQVLVSKVIPVERRGTLGGFRNVLSGLTASAVGVAGGYMIEAETLGNGYASVFLVSFVLTAAGLCALLFMREPESPVVRASSALRERIRELPELVRGQPSYRRYLVAVSLGEAGRMALPYYVIDAGERMGLGGDSLGWLTGAFLVASTASHLFWGPLADRGGFRNVLALSIATWGASTLVVAYADALPALTIGFVGIGAGLGGFQLGSTNLVLEFGERRDVPMRIALGQTAQQLVAVAAPLVGALLAELTGYRVLFWTSVLVQGIGLLVTVFGVREPRATRARPRESSDLVN